MIGRFLCFLGCHKWSMGFGNIALFCDRCNQKLSWPSPKYDAEPAHMRCLVCNKHRNTINTVGHDFEFDIRRWICSKKCHNQINNIPIL